MKKTIMPLTLATLLIIGTATPTFAMNNRVVTTSNPVCTTQGCNAMNAHQHNGENYAGHRAGDGHVNHNYNKQHVDNGHNNQNRSSRHH